MSLRKKVMLVLLIAAVLPMLAVRAVQAVSIYRVQNEVAQETRQRVNDQAQADMQRAVKGYAHSLDQVRRLGLSLLRNQANEVDARLVGPVPRQQQVIPSVQEFAAYERSNDGPYAIEPSQRHAVITEDGERKPLNVSFDTQVYLSFEEQVSNDSVDDLARLAGMSPIYRAINDQVDQTILWQYTTLKSGMHFSYPAKSAFAQDYNPTEQAWYQRAVQARQAVTSQPYIDAATGQLVITFAQPVYSRGNTLAGVTAIDLRVSALLDPQALNTAWQDDTNVMVVASYPAREQRHSRPQRDNARDRQRNRQDRPDRRPNAPDPGDTVDPVADTSYPADVYIVADVMHDHSGHLDQQLIETVGFDKAEMRRLVTEDLIAGVSNVRRVLIDGQDRMIAYGQIGRGEAGRSVFVMIVAPTQTIQQPAELAVLQINEDLTESLVTTGGILLLMLVIVFASAFMMSFRLTRPITELADASNRVARGDLNAQVKIKGNDELGQLGEAFNKMVPALRDRMKIRESLAVAMQVQQSLLPQESPKLKGLDIAGHSEYCDETGGDYYDFIHLDQLGPDHLAIAVGDVTGHGIAAALLMATARALIRSHANTTQPLGDIFTDVNKQLCDSEFTGRFMTLMYLIVENPGQTNEPIRMRFLSAGHDPVVVYRPADDRFFELAGNDIPLGIDKEWQYHQETSDALRPGDIMVVGTDGIWECFNTDSEQFGKDRMRDTIRQSAIANGTAQDIASAISQACKNWRGKREQNDDITLVVVKLDA